MHLTISAANAISMLPNGTLIIADQYNVKVVAANGALLATTMMMATLVMGPTIFVPRKGVELVGDTLWIADSGNDRIARYKLTFD